MTGVPRIPVRAVVSGLILSVVLAHGSAIRDGFLYDDYHLIAENPAVITHDWGAIWTSSDAASREAAGRNYRPVTMTTYAVDHWWGGGRPGAFHATQVALHAIVVCLVYGVASAMGLGSTAALIAALVVAWHPAQIEAVHYLSARASILSGIGILASFWAYVVWRAAPHRRGLLALSVTAMGFAVLSKETAVMGPLWMAAWELVQGTSPRLIIVRIAPCVSVVAAALLPRLVLPGPSDHAAAVSAAAGWATGIAVVGRHVLAWTTPWVQDPVSPQPWMSGEDPTVWALALLVCAMGALAWAIRRRAPLAAWGLVAALAALTPVMALPWMTNVALFQPHRGYLGSIGFAVAAVAGGAMWWKAARPRILREGVVVGGLVVILGAAAVWMNVDAGRLWRNEIVFWQAAVERHPAEAGYSHSLGAALLRANDAPGALAAFATAERLDPHLPRVHYNLGLTYTKLGRTVDAVSAYERAVERDPTDHKALANLGWLYEREGRVDRAVIAYRAALAVDPRADRVRVQLEQLVRRVGALSDGHR